MANSRKFFLKIKPLTGLSTTLALILLMGACDNSSQVTSKAIPISLNPKTTSATTEAIKIPTQLNQDFGARVVQDFFATLQNNPVASINYLGKNLKESIIAGRVSLVQLLGVQTRPATVEISKVSDMSNTYKVIMHFADHPEQTAYVDVSADELETIAISDIRQTTQRDPSRQQTRENNSQDDLLARASIADYFAYVQVQNYKLAYNLLSQEIKQQIKSVEELEKWQNGKIRYINVTDMKEYPNPTDNANHLTYLVTLDVQPGKVTSSWQAGSNQCWIEVVKENGSWKLTNFTTTPPSK